MKNIRFNAWLIALMAIGYLGAWTTAPHVVSAFVFMTIAFAVGAKRPAWGLSPSALLFLVSSLTAAAAMATWSMRAPDWIEMGLFCHAGLGFLAGPRARRIGEGVLLLVAAAFFIVSAGLIRSPQLLLTVPAILVAATGALLSLAFPQRRAPLARMIADHVAMLAGLSIVLFLLSPLPAGGIRTVSNWLGRPLSRPAEPTDARRGGPELWTFRPIPLEDVTQYKSVPTPVMNVAVESGRENLLRWPKPALYLRGGVFDTYVRAKWYSFAPPEKRVSGNDGWAALRDADRRTPNVQCAVTLLHDPTRVLFALGEPLAMETAEIEVDTHDGVRLRWELGALKEFRFRSRVPPSSEAMQAALPAKGDPIDTVVPPELEPLARRGLELKGGATSAMEIARLIIEDLQKNCRYEMVPGHPTRGQDPVVFFYERGHAGNCRHFATAGLAMLRGAGVPCRLVTGFLSDDWNAATNTFKVLARDLHAWLEIQVDGFGWVTVDPTPPMHFGKGETIVVPGRNQGEPERYFDPATGEEIITAPGASARGPSVVDRVKTFVGDLQIPEVPWIATAAGLLVLGALLALPAVKHAAERRLGRVGGTKRERSPVAFLNEFLLLLKSAGHAPAPHETMPRFATRLPAACPRTAVEAVVRLYHAARFGGALLTDDEIASVREALRSLRLALKR